MPARQPATRLNPGRLIASGHNGIDPMNRRVSGRQAPDAFEISVDDHLRHGVRRHRDQGGVRGSRDDRPNGHDRNRPLGAQHNRRAVHILPGGPVPTSQTG